MRIIKAFAISFSMYSQIPMPQFEWREEDMKYPLCFFPWIGAVIGGLTYFWVRLCVGYGMGRLCCCLIGAAIPILITGGLHVDGFMDTMDAFHSYQQREQKLEIMKDPHIGGFSVIMLAVCGLIYIGAFSEISDETLLKIFCAGFFLSRCLSGIGVVSFQTAKKEGLLCTFADSADRIVVKGALYLQALACIGLMLRQSLYAGSIAVAASFCVFAYYYLRCKWELGGITGDTAGYFVVLCEGWMAVVCAILNHLM